MHTTTKTQHSHRDISKSDFVSFFLSFFFKTTATWLICSCLVTKLCRILLWPHELPGSSVHGISQARTLEWVAISFLRGSSRPRDRTSIFWIGRQILYHWATKEARPGSLSSVHLLSSGQLFATLDCSTPGYPVYHQLPQLLKHEFVMPSNHPILCHPLLLPLSIFPSIRVFSSESVLRIRWPKYWSFSFHISPSSEYSGLISFRINWFDLPAVQGTLKSLLQHHSSKASILRHSAFFMIQLSHPYMTTGKTVALTRWTVVGKVTSLPFNMLSSFVIAFLPGSKHLLISWLQSPSAVIWEPKKIKSLTVSIVSSSICHEVMGLDAMILVFLNVEF